MNIDPTLESENSLVIRNILFTHYVLRFTFHEEGEKMNLTVIGTSILNLFIVIALSPLFEGVARKLRATVHSRKGPPIRQPYYDLLKLLSKENLQSSPNYLVRLAPLICFATVILAALLVPMGTAKAPFDAFGDAILFVYLITLAAVALIIAAASSENPFAFVGASREMMMHLCVEPVLVIALITAAINTHSLRMGDMLAWYHIHGPIASMVIAAVFFFLALQAQVGKLPFDIPEAETEIVGGVFIEQSGPKYALFRWYMMAKQMVFCFVFVQIFIPWPRFDFVPLDILANLVKVLVLVSIIALIDVVNPRLRIDQAVKYYLFLVLFSLGSVAFALIGA